MRVVAGSARGRRLVAPDGLATRPTTDRVREAVFNMVFALGGVADARVADLFAGSGALGVEALSRGAQHATFVEHDRRAVAAIVENLGRLGFADRATVVRDDVGVALQQVAEPFDVVFADPPYAFDGWRPLFGALDVCTTADAIVVCESDRTVEPGPGWLVQKDRSYGGTVITIVRRHLDQERS